MERFYDVLRRGIPEARLLECVEETVKEPQMTYQKSFPGKPALAIYDRVFDFGKIRVIAEERLSEEQKTYEVMDVYLVESTCSKACCTERTRMN